MNGLTGMEKFSHLEDKIYLTIEFAKKMREEKEKMEREVSTLRRDAHGLEAERQRQQEKLQRDHYNYQSEWRRKTEEREKAAAALSERDRTVLIAEAQSRAETLRAEKLVLMTNTTGSESLASKNEEAIRNAKFYPIVRKGFKKEFLYYYRVDY